MYNNNSFRKTKGLLNFVFSKHDFIGSMERKLTRFTEMTSMKIAFAAKLLSAFFCILTLTLAPRVHAQTSFAYYGLEPDIVTNYLGNSSRSLGFVRVTVELMLEDADYLEAAQHHSPLLRATVIDIFGRQPEEKVKSLTGREEIRQMSLEKLRALLKKETGNEMIKDVIFTKYLYQGG